MSVSRTVGGLIVAACMAALPVAAQTGDTSATKVEKKVEKKTAKAEVKAERKVSKSSRSMGVTAGSRLFGDATRLAGLLVDIRTNVNVSEAVWRTVVNEANTLANRMYANSRGANRTAAASARTHVREMREAALKGDAAGARTHAGEALPFVYRIIDATAPR